MRHALIVLTAWFASFPALSAAKATAPNEQVTKIATQPQWLKLVHYEKTSRGWRSTADRGKFFFADALIDGEPVGKTNPSAELQATIRALQSTTPHSKETPHAQCGFPARFHFIRKHINATWPSIECADLDQHMEYFSPAKLQIVFSDAFMGNPASMFGHTMMRIDRINHDDPVLLRNAIDFAAFTDGVTGGFDYAVRGLVGLYPGGYELVPYHRKVKKYNHDENRDMWEYELLLTPEEVDMVLMHVWELHGIGFDYYFSDENCSYQLLALLEVARPTLDLVRQHGLLAVPPETIQRLGDANLLGKPTFRTARARALIQNGNTLNAQERALAEQLISQPNAPQTLLNQSSLTPVRQAAAVEVAYDALGIAMRQDKARAEEMGERRSALLLARSKLPAGSPFEPVKRPAFAPHEGHGGGALRPGLVHRDGDTRIAFSHRLVYHDLLDPPVAIQNGAQIKAFEFNWELSADSEEIDLRKFTLMELTSLTPQTRFINQRAWSMELFWEKSVEDHSTTSLRYRRGTSLALGEHQFVYALAGARVDYAPTMHSAYRIAPSGIVGWHYSPSASFSSLLEVSADAGVVGADHAELKIQLGQQYNFTTDIGLRWQVGRRIAVDTQRNKHHQGTKGETEMGLGLAIYF